MSITLRQYRRGGWRYQLRKTLRHGSSKGASANRQKASTVAAKQSILTNQRDPRASVERCGPGATPTHGHSLHWHGHVAGTKSKQVRHVPSTTRLAAALHAHRHLRGSLVACQIDGQPLTQMIQYGAIRRAARRARVTRYGIHMLGHTFYSHLAMRGAPAHAIQELAGHQDLGTTQRYIHLSPAAIASAIRLLDGDGPETAIGAGGSRLDRSS